MKCINHPMTDAIGICIGCGKPICEMCKVETGGEIYCKKCISEKVSTQAKKQKSPILAAILSFIIGGMGQVYNGQAGKGLLIFFTTWLIIPWIYGIIDAYKTADRINTGEISVPQKPGCVIAVIIVMIMMPFCAAIIGLMAAIAIPSFVLARNTAQANMCVNNLQFLDQAKQIYAVEYGLEWGNIIPSADNNGIDDEDGIPDVLEIYFETAPQCPSGGQYTIGKIGELPRCSIGDNDTARMTRDDHIIRKE